MAYKTSYNAALGMQAFSVTAVDTIQRDAIGTILRGFDDLLGEGEFMYLPGAAGLLSGDAVVVDMLPGAQSVTRASTAQANAGQMFAIAQTAVPAGSYGWFQVSGCAIANVVAGTVAGRAMLSATVGALSSAPSNGAQIIGGRITSAAGTPLAGQAYVTLNRPSVQSQTA